MLSCMVQQKLRELQDIWLSRTADVLSAIAPLLIADRTTIFTERSKFVERWIEHLISVLNRTSSNSDEAINRLPQVQVHMYKRRGNRQSCDNHIGIYLLSIARKGLARILFDHLFAYLDQCLSAEGQWGFKKEHDRKSIKNNIIYTSLLWTSPRF